MVLVTIGTKRKDKNFVRLRSDFRDYYDHWFSHNVSEPILLRGMHDGPTRFEALHMLKNYYNVPSFGLAKNADFTNDDGAVVLHFSDEHAGRGKVITTLRDARIAAPDKLVVQYHSEARTRSYRLLSVGSMRMSFMYESHYWRSNVGDVEVAIIDPFCYNFEEINNRYPLYAIDFIETSKGFLAIDFNVSPGLEALKGIIQPWDVVYSIEKAVTLQSRTVSWGG